MRDLSEAVNYYVLVVTSENARLLVGTNGTLIKEVVGDSPRQEVHDELAFPIKIPHYQQAVNQTVQAHQMTTAISKSL